MAKKKIGTIYYVEPSGDNRNDGLDHGGYIRDKYGIIRRNIHPLRTIQKAINKIAKHSDENT